MSKNSKQNLIFDQEIQMQDEMELIQYIRNELTMMDMGYIREEDIVIFDDFEVNAHFIRALNYMIHAANKKESFFNQGMLYDFVTKLIVWAYSYLREVDFGADEIPVCLYYGMIQRHEVYFLILLYHMGFSVVYINPLKEEYFEEIDEDKVSTCIKEMGMVQIESLAVKVARGEVIEHLETVTKQIERAVQEELFSNIGIYKPWQFRKGYTKAVLYHTTLDEIFSYWNEPARLREGFKVENEQVQIPCFFYKIDGEHADKGEYQRLVKYCTESPDTVLFKQSDLLQTKGVSEEIYQLMFCQLSDGTFDPEEIRKLPFYKLGHLNQDIQNFLIDKFNEMIQEDDVFIKQLDKETVLEFLSQILDLNTEIKRCINNFDFTGNIPKIVIYLEGEEAIPEATVRLIAYLHYLGLDIILFNPSGMFNMQQVLREEVFNVVRLPKMEYQATYRDLMNYKENRLVKFLKRKGGI